MSSKTTSQDPVHVHIISDTTCQVVPIQQRSLQDQLRYPTTVVWAADLRHSHNMLPKPAIRIPGNALLVMGVGVSSTSTLGAVGGTAWGQESPKVWKLTGEILSVMFKHAVFDTKPRNNH